MSCFGCFSSPKIEQPKLTVNSAQQASTPAGRHEVQPATDTATTHAKAVLTETTTPLVVAAPQVVTPPQPVVSIPPTPPWRSREELAEIALRMADASGTWLERANKSATVLADSLEASLVSIWAFSSDRTSAVVVGSGGLLQTRQAQGHCVSLSPAAYKPVPQSMGPLAAASLTEPAGNRTPAAVVAAVATAALAQAPTTLERILGGEASFTWTVDSASPSPDSMDSSPSDLKQLSTATGVQHCAVLPLKCSGSLAGALQICLGGSLTHKAQTTEQLPGHRESVSSGDPSPPQVVLPPLSGGISQPSPKLAGSTGLPADREEVASGIGVGGGAAALKSLPNWLPHHLPDLLLLTPAAAAVVGGGSGAGYGIGGRAGGVAAGGGNVGGSAAAAARSIPLTVVDLVSTLRRCDTICKLISALILGLQDLSYRVTSMQFCVTPMLVHRSGVTAAIFQDVGPSTYSAAVTMAAAAAGTGGGDRSEPGDGDGRGGGGGLVLASSAASSPPMVGAQSQGQGSGRGPFLEASPEAARVAKAHVTHLNHTLMLQLITGADHSRHSKLYGGAIIQNCSEYMQDESNRGRDVSLCHRVGVADTGSLLLLASSSLSSPGGMPLLASYLTSKEPLPEPLLESALAAAHQAFKLALPVTFALLTRGDLAEEWSTLHDIYLNPSSVAVSTSCTPRSFVRSTTKEVTQGTQGAGPIGTSGPAGGTMQSGFHHTQSLPLSGGPGGGLIGSGPNDDGLPATAHSNSATRNLSFNIAESSAAAAPRSNLGMMVSSIRSSLNQVLSQRAALEAEGLQDDVNGVELLKQIGQGGQGVVFCGTLHGLEVAIKVVGTEEGADEVYDIDDEGAMIKLKRVLKRDATELAVTTSISHPNIVQVFSYFVDVMVVEYVGQPDRFKLLPRAKGLQGNQGGGQEGDGGGISGPSNMIICMEYCDAGSLKQAVKRGCFRTEQTRPNMQSLYTTLMEIALALRHLHALRLVHCDLKPSNILLKSSMRDPRGWVCKLSDFGCVRLMSEPAAGCRPSFNLEYAVGTPSFMAPEMFCKGHPLDAAVDIYSFGILMWELYTGNTVYDGVPPDKLPYHVVKRGLRPAFPPEAPSAFRSLAQACWASEPRSRPTAAALVTVLQRLLSSSIPAAAATGAGGLGVGR